MRVCAKVLVLGLLLVSWSALGAFDQDQSNTSTPSLGDLARQVKAQKAKEAKPAKVFTNDNLPPPNGTGFSSPVNTSKETSAPEAAGGTPSAHDEKYYRERMRTLQEQLDTHKRELDVLQQKLGQNNMQYYPNPQDSLMQQYSRSDINKLTAEIDAKKKQIADDEKAIDDLREQLRQEGGDPGWLR